MASTKVCVDPYEADSTQLIRQLVCRKQVKTERSWYGVFIVSAMLLSVVSTTISTLAIYKVLELSSVVTDLRAACHHGSAQAAGPAYQTAGPEYQAAGLGHQEEIEIAGEDGEDVDDFEDIDGDDNGEILDEVYYQSSSGEPWPLFPDDEDNDMDTYDVYADEETLIRERRAASGNKNRHKKNGRDRTRTGRDRPKCQFRVGRKDHALKSSEECLNALDNFVKNKVDEVNPNAPMHLVANISLTNQEESVYKLNQSMSRPMEHGDMYYQGFVPRNETMEFWSVPDWITSNDKSKSTYTLHPAEGEVRAVEIKVTGLYLVYAQITYHETRSPLEYYVIKGKTDQSRPVKLLQCEATIDHVNENGEPISKAVGKSCDVSGLTWLQRGDVIYILAQTKRKLTTTPRSTFWGLLLISK